MCWTGVFIGLILGPVTPAKAQSWAHYFRIEESGGGTIVTVGNRSRNIAEESYLLGQELPLPAARVVVLSSTQAPGFEALDAVDRIVAVSRGHWFYSRDIRARLAEGSVRSVGAGETLDLEALVAAGPDLVIGYPDVLPAAARRRLERDFGIAVLSVWDYLEPHPLGRAEWILVLGALLGRAEEARALFAEIEERYLETKDLVDGATADRPRPRVLLNAPMGDLWPVPREASHAAVFVRDAGGAPVPAPPGDGVAFLDPEVVLPAAASAGLWINPGSARSLRELREISRFAPEIAAYRDRGVYAPVRRISPEGAWDFYESGYLYPDRILRDLVAIINPGLLPQADLYYYRRLE